ncbi:aminotransferase class IV [Streptomyces sp. SID13031]|uniref:aminotransferase class IV n=1 Tax=Streptomyces sp. SID13031 TaxID=2706046 RepID=UPI0013C587F7|nr:aminotransferase class IV [Streptomyces sp. SID13031]NEA37388.1 aminotransferase class IV [Streptomyces sp. SID13031]
MTSLQVADSFLVANGKVRGLDLHRRRFTASCAALGVEAGEYFDDQVKRLPAFGRWFPRFELDADDNLSVHLRPALPQGGRIRVVVHDGPDPRTRPLVKGPDLEALGALKSQATKAFGADEVLLTDPDGVVVEAAYSAVLWWEDDTLCIPPTTRAYLPSVTSELVRRIAAAEDIEVAERARTAADLATTEVWLLNALHGIRPVEAWNHDPIDPLPFTRSKPWQQTLLGLATGI